MDEPKQFFTVRDVAAMWGQERAQRDGKPLSEAQPLSVNTVHRHVNAAVPATDTRKAGRYADNPPPKPTRVTQRSWAWFPAPGQTMQELEEELRAWFRSRPGQGAGGGPRPGRSKN